MSKFKPQRFSSNTLLFTVLLISILSTLHFISNPHEVHPMIQITPTVYNIIGFIPNATNNDEWDPLLVPYRNATNKAIAWRKFYNGTGKLIVIHARKAGGSTTKKWMGLLIKRIRSYYKETLNQTWNSTFKAHEFWTYYHKDDRNKMDAIFKENPFAVYVMAFRDPLERIISQYDFEWRWGCQKCTVSSQMFHDKEPRIMHNGRTFMKYYKYPNYDSEKSKHKLKSYKKFKLSNIELDELLTRVDKYQNMDNKHVKYKIAFNAYLNNYYLWMFCCNSIHCNIEKDFIKTKRINKCMDHAMRMILSFDIVLVDEWMNDIRTQQYVNRLLFGNISITGYIGMDSAFKRIKQKNILTSRGKNTMIQNDLYQKLQQLNQWDLKLYEFVKKTAFKQVRDMW